MGARFEGGWLASERARAHSEAFVKLTVFGGVLSACVIACAPARAADSGSAEVSYAGATVACDLSSLGVGLSSAPLQSAVPSYVGFAGYFLCAPIVHAAHGGGDRAAGSVGLRIGLPAAGALIGAGIFLAADKCHGELCGLGGVVAMIAGAAVGAIAASIVDAAVLAKEPASAAPPAPPVGPTTQTFGFSF